MKSVTWLSYHSLSTYKRKKVKFIHFSLWPICFIVLSLLVEYHIVIICSNEEEEKSYLISKLYLYERPYVQTREISLKDFKDYLIIHFTKQVKKAKNNSSFYECLASTVDFEKYVLSNIL